MIFSVLNFKRKNCGQWWIRTTEVERQRIYSPPHLAALETAHLFYSAFAESLFQKNFTENVSTDVVRTSDLPYLQVGMALPFSLSQPTLRTIVSRKLESNQRPTDYKSVALPTELFRQVLKNLISKNKGHTKTPLFFGKAKVREND